MKLSSSSGYDFRVVAAGRFKATCLQLLDEVDENRNLSIIITKRGKPVGQLSGSPEGLKLTGPTVQVGSQKLDDEPIVMLKASAAVAEQRKKKKDKKKKHK